MTAEEKHEFDKKRFDKILKSNKKYKIIVIWESSFNKINKEIILQNIKEFINDNKNEGCILWI